MNPSVLNLASHLFGKGSLNRNAIFIYTGPYIRVLQSKGIDCKAWK